MKNKMPLSMFKYRLIIPGVSVILSMIICVFLILSYRLSELALSILSILIFLISFFLLTTLFHSKIDQEIENHLDLLDFIF